MGLFAPRKTHIFLKNNTGINKKSYGIKLEVTLTDGTLQEIPAIRGNDSERLREIILGLM